MTKGAGLRPEAKATEPPPDPTVGAPVLDSTVIRNSYAVMVTLPDGQKLEVKRKWSVRDIDNKIARRQEG